MFMDLFSAIVFILIGVPIALIFISFLMLLPFAILKGISWFYWRSFDSFAKFFSKKEYPKKDNLIVLEEKSNWKKKAS